MTALFALVASLLWGSSDFGGGLISRRIDPAAAVLMSQAAALAGLLLLLPFLPAPGGRYLIVAAGAGVFGSLSLACFYQSMADAPLSLVAPITAAGTGIPVLVGLARGEQLSGPQATGLVVTLAGVILACGPEFRPGVGARRSAVLFAIAAALGFGVTYTLLALAADDGSLYGTLLAQRAGGFLALGPIVLFSGRLRDVRLTFGRLAALAAVGSSDIVANGCYAFAASRGQLAIAAVLASLYPVVTALLARGLLAERLRAVQTVGVITALSGVLLLST